MITVSAPGKLIVLGEHAVVYDRPCIVSAVSQRLTLRIEETRERGVVLETPGVKDTRFIDAAIAVVRDRWTKTLPGLRITTESTFSGLYGFGSSSAVTVATLFALRHLLGRPGGLQEIFELA